MVGPLSESKISGSGFFIWRKEWKRFKKLWTKYLGGINFDLAVSVDLSDQKGGELYPAVIALRGE
jgi:hypothetical protein